MCTKPTSNFSSVTLEEFDVIGLLRKTFLEIYLKSEFSSKYFNIRWFIKYI